MPGESTDLALDAPTILLVASGERLAPAIQQYLQRHGADVEVASADEVAGTAFVAAPDLIVLAGDAADDGGADVLATLAANPVTSTLPVVLVSDSETERRVGAFRHGVVAVVQRSASADEVARRIADVARDIPTRSGETAGELKIESADELVELLAESLRSGMLSVQNEAGESVQVMLHAERPVEEAMAELLDRIRPLAGERQTGELRYAFQESAPSRMSAIDLHDESEGPLDRFVGRRILLVEQSPTRADVLAQDLRSADATVVVIDGSGSELELARELRPEIVIVSGDGMEGWALGALSAIRRDPWLRWASLLLVESTRLWRNPRRPDLAILAHRVHGLVKPDLDLARRAMEEEQLDTRLEAIGPIRTLHALASTGLGLRIRVHHRRVVVEVDLADGLIAGARASVPNDADKSTEGPAALASLLGLASGRVRIRRAVAPRSADIMSPVDSAISAAERDQPLVAPSIPPPPSLPSPGMPTLPQPSKIPSDLASADMDSLVIQLEGLLTKLRGDESDAPPAKPAATVPKPAGQMIDPATLEPFAERAEGEVDTGLYNPRLVARLRKRMTSQSQSKMQAGGEAPGPKPRVAVPPPGGRKLPPPKKRIPPAGGLPPKGKLPPGRKRRARTLVMGSAAEEPPEEEAVTEEKAKPPAEEQSPVEPTVEVSPPPFAMGGPAEEAAPVEVAPAEAATVEAQDAPVEEAPVEEAPVEEAPVEEAPVEEAPVPEAPFGGEPAGETPVEASEAPLEGEAASAPEPDLFAATVDEPVPAVMPPAAGLDRRLIIGGAAALGGLVLLVLIVVIASLGSDEETVTLPSGEETPVASDPSGPEVETTPAPEPADPEPADPDPEPPPSADPPTADPAAAAGSTAVAPDDPIAGRNGDLDLTTYGVVPSGAPSSRRARNRLLTRLLQQGNQARRQGELDLAESRYQEVLGMDAEQTRAIAGLSRVYLDRGRPRHAVPLVQRLCRLRPRFARNFVFLGTTLEAAGDPAAARRAYLRALELDPTFESARERLGELDGH